jgi:hypothetical protein
MSVRTVGFLAVLLGALVLIPSGAHLAELPNKMDLARDEYLVAQQIYRGWALFGFVIVSALIFTLALTIKVRHSGPAFRLALTALLCLVGGQVIFWAFTFPANQATENWTVLPSNWAALRIQWEYSHAVAAVFNLTAFIALTLALLSRIGLHPESLAAGRESL